MGYAMVLCTIKYYGASHHEPALALALAPAPAPAPACAWQWVMWLQCDALMAHFAPNREWLKLKWCVVAYK